MTPEEIAEKIAKHVKWLNDEEGGERADFSGAILSGAYFSGAILSGAYFSRADLSGANLNRAYFSGADFSGAILSGAYFSGANLNRAYFSGADFSGAILNRADLSGADFSGANLNGADFSGAILSGAYLNAETKLDPIAVARLRIVPDGVIIGWKKLHGGAICKLKIPAHAKRSNGTGRKCRASEAKVLEIYDRTGKPVTEGWSCYRKTFIYRVGETVRPDKWEENWWVECGGGIHFFITREEAEAYE